MELADFARELLSNECPVNDVDRENDTGIREFVFYLHCVKVEVTAKYLGWDIDKNTGDWKILSLKWGEN